MEIKNPLYKNIGAHVISSIFTIDKGKIKVLLIKRNNEPFKDKWALVGGAMYNNELIETAAKRELKEETGVENATLINPVTAKYTIILTTILITVVLYFFLLLFKFLYDITPPIPNILLINVGVLILLFFIFVSSLFLIAFIGLILLALFALFLADNIIVIKPKNIENNIAKIDIVNVNLNSSPNAVAKK